MNDGIGIDIDFTEGPWDWAGASIVCEALYRSTDGKWVLHRCAANKETWELMNTENVVAWLSPAETKVNKQPFGSGPLVDGPLARK